MFSVLFENNCTLQFNIESGSNFGVWRGSITVYKGRSFQLGNITPKSNHIGLLFYLCSDWALPLFIIVYTSVINCSMNPQFQWIYF